MQHSKFQNVQIRLWFALFQTKWERHSRRHTVTSPVKVKDTQLMNNNLPVAETSGWRVCLRNIQCWYSLKYDMNLPSQLSRWTFQMSVRKSITIFYALFNDTCCIWLEIHRKNKPVLVQIIAWSRRGTSHYLNQYRKWTIEMLRLWK